jgi:hypothetical protein
MKIPNWTLEQISKWSTDQVKLVRDRALQQGVQEIVDRCNQILAERLPAKKITKTIQLGKRNRQNANELHFVCKPKDKGVTFNADGTAWSGTWVVGKPQAEHVVKVKGMVCLHLTRTEPSYRQGIVLDWRPAERGKVYAEDGRETKTKYGIDFLLKLTDAPLNWKGDATGEKGYGYEEPTETPSQV